MDSTNSEPTGPQGQASMPPGSPPKAEDDLDFALNGQEPTVKNLILAAIGVMKVNFMSCLAPMQCNDKY